MELTISQEKMNLLMLTPMEVAKINLATRIPIDNISSCQNSNQQLVDALQIIALKNTMLKAKTSTLKDKNKNYREYAITRLIRAKSEYEDKNAALAENKAAYDAWEKAGKVGSFVAPNNMSEFENVSDITASNPAKFTDSSMKSLAETASNIKFFDKEYYQMLECNYILEGIKDYVVDIAKIINTQVMSFGTENKMNGGGR